LVAAARLVSRAGLRLEPGWVVMAGGATAAVALKAGDHVRVVVEDLGQVNLTVTP
jgi:2-oxo-3-hexenedioate decarboxylase